MSEPKTNPAPAPRRDLEAWLSRLLTASVLLAAVTGVAGIVLHLRQHRGLRADLSSFVPEHEALREPAQIVSGAGSLDSAAVLQLAVLLLVLTPIARVVCALVVFAIKRDLLYVGVSLGVLAALAVGLVLGH
jgi:uncharacterized membrane protein